MIWPFTVTSMFDYCSAVFTKHVNAEQFGCLRELDLSDFYGCS